MNESTRRALAALSQRFYAANAEHFDETRSRPWRGWKRALEAFRDPPTPLRVLDLGCGNGRLLTHLQATLNVPIAYLGIDECEPLLELARIRHRGENVRFERGELIDAHGAAQVPEQAFDFVALMGVLHHIPSERARSALVRAAWTRVAPGGLLVLTAWHFASDPRLSQRIVDWSDAALPLDVAELEPGDALVRWGDDPDAVRYCHDASSTEIDRWLACLTSAARVERFFADGASGALNEYVVVRVQSV